MTVDLSVELTEVEKVQNSALGAYLLWAFALEYQQGKEGNTPATLLLFFLVLPICFHRPTLDIVSGTLASSGLGKFCEKLGKNREELFAIHERSLSVRELTLNSIAMGIRAGLFTIDYKTGLLYANEHPKPKGQDFVKPHLKGAIKLGAWFSRIEHSQIFNSLKVSM